MPTELPTFDRPPLTEVFLAAQFAPLPQLRTAHLGEFLSALGPTWSPLPDAPALGQTREPVDSTPEWLLPGTLEIDLRTGTRLRAQSAGADRMLQVENGWLALNWAGGPGRDYPRFAALSAEYEQQYERWSRFLAERGLGTVVPNLWEVGYVNVFPRGELWNELGDIVGLLPRLLGSGPGSAGALQTISGRWAYLIAPGVGRLQVFVEHALRHTPELGECVQLRLIARGPVREGFGSALWQGLAIGHESIVQTFAELLSDKAKRHLGYRP